MRGHVRQIIDCFANSDYFSLFKSRMEAMTHHHSTALATAEHQMNMNKFGYYSCAAPEISASLLEDWDAGHIPHLKSLIASSGYELLIAKSGIGSFLIEVIAPAIIHLWIVGDLECSQSQALEVLVDQRAGDYGRLILNSELMKQVGAARVDVTEKQPSQMAEGNRSGHYIPEGEQSSSLTQPRRVLRNRKRC